VAHIRGERLSYADTVACVAPGSPSQSKADGAIVTLVVFEFMAGVLLIT
jgi:hypothetical protein